jgi:hypothetical protein
MRLKEAILMAAAVVASGACHGELEIGGSGDGSVSTVGSSSGSQGSGSGSGGVMSGGLSVPSASPDGGTIVIGPQTSPVTKLDLLFMIDNSASMGDKQAYLEQAIPDLVARLATPNCVNPNSGAVDGPSTVLNNGTADCSSYTSADPASAPEFPAMADMHIGIVSSSLGPRLGDKYGNGMGGACNPTAMTVNINGTTLLDHNDDQAHLLTRSSDPTINLAVSPPTEVTLPDATPSGFLAWYPTLAENTGSAGADPAITSAPQLDTDFSDLMAGVHDFGCGIESQLESWYRFLIQPDPYASLALDANNLAQWVGVDTTIIKERHDFLRPDSLVAIVDLTDENDSEIDVRSLGGQGYVFMSTSFEPPHGTAACATNPGDPSCTTLGPQGDPNPYSMPNDWGYDLNLRHVHMKAKYGLDPQFPISRYQNGLLSAVVPDRTGEYPSGATAYVGTNDCTNPLFAASLPDGSTLSASIATSVSATDAATLCKLPQGTRPSSLVFYLHIGGVPWQLLHFDPTSAANSQLTDADWVRILGNDPLNYDYTGIDPHMIESYAPRTSEPFATATPLRAINGASGTSAAETAPQAANSVTAANAGVPDPYNGREWVTNSTAGTGGANHVDLAVDRQYACIFKLAVPRDCSRTTEGNYTVPANGNACDCSSTGLTPDELSPVCNPSSPNQQLYAKAYPTIRELELAKFLGPQGLVASICPADVADNASGDDPLYGYRPAIAGLVNRMQSALAFK